mgnify:CR=1 FL=1
MPSKLRPPSPISIVAAFTQLSLAGRFEPPLEGRFGPLRAQKCSLKFKTYHTPVIARKSVMLGRFRRYSCDVPPSMSRLAHGSQLQLILQ